MLEHQELIKFYLFACAEFYAHKHLFFAYEEYKNVCEMVYRKSGYKQTKKLQKWITEAEQEHNAPGFWQQLERLDTDLYRTVEDHKDNYYK